MALWELSDLLRQMVARDRLEGVGAVASSRAAEIYKLGNPRGLQVGPSVPLHVPYVFAAGRAELQSTGIFQTPANIPLAFEGRWYLWPMVIAWCSAPIAASRIHFRTMRIT